MTNFSKIIYLITLLSTLTLSGCAQMKGPPSCPNSNGLTCTRVDQINRLVNRGQLGIPKATITSNKKTKSSNAYFTTFSKNNLKKLKDPQSLWHSSKAMRIWLAPYQDSDGNYHQASFIDTIVQPGYWAA